MSWWASGGQGEGLSAGDPIRLAYLYNLSPLQILHFAQLRGWENWSSDTPSPAFQGAQGVSGQGMKGRSLPPPSQSQASPSLQRQGSNMSPSSWGARRGNSWWREGKKLHSRCLQGHHLHTTLPGDFTAPQQRGPFCHIKLQHVEVEKVLIILGKGLATTAPRSLACSAPSLHLCKP